ncbi:MAG: AAA family ATPase [Ilumatobacter sp.]
MDGTSFRFDGFELDTARFELRSGAQRIALEPRAFDVLHHLVMHRDRVVPKEELLDTLWGGQFVGEAALTTALRTARVAIGDSGKEQRLIRTVVRRGYQFVGDVHVTAATASVIRSSDIALPVRMIESSGLGFAGRDDERTVLENACKEVAATGQRQLVLISGEAGIGKTTLCSLVATAAHRDGAVVLYGRCDDELSIPYQPWQEVFSGLQRDMPEAIETRHSALVPLLGGTGADEMDSDSARFALYSAVIEVLDTVCADGRLTLIVLDDLHWADVQTLALLRHLMQSALTTPVLVVGTFRDTDINAAHPLAALLAQAHREPGTTRLALERLGDGELLTLLENLAGHEMDDDGIALRDALLAETEGNPFFVNEILRHLTETGAIGQHDDGRWITPTDLQAQGLPVSVREVISRRVERLGPEARTALDTASIIGREFELGLLAELLGEGPASVFGRLTPAVDNSLVSDSGGRFEFSHALVAHALYSELSPTARALGHEAVAVALEQRISADSNDGASQIAHHWMRAIGPHSQARAAEFAQRAGDQALLHLAPDDAVTWYRHALDSIPAGDTTQRCEVLVGLGTAQRQAGYSDHRETLLTASQIATDLGDDDLLVRAALANNRGEASSVGEIDDERIDVLRRAIEVRPDGADAALLQAILSIEMFDGPDGSTRAAASRAMQLARQVGDDRVMVRVVRLAESSLRTPDELERREAWLREGVEAAERTGDPLLRGTMAMSHHEISLELGDRDAMNHERRIRHEFAQRSPEPFVRWTNEQTRWTHLFLDGELDEAEALANQSLEYALSTEQPEAIFAYAGQIFQVRRAQGRLHEVAEQFDELAAENSSIQVFKSGHAFMCCEVGREDDARASACDIDLSRGDAPQFWSTTLMNWSEVCHTLSLPEPAGRIAELLDPWRHRVASTGATTEGSIAHGVGRALATAGRIDDAAAAYEQALIVNAGLRAPLFVARTQLAYAELLADIEPDRAKALVTEALTAADRFGFTRVAFRGDALLARLA